MNAELATVQRIKPHTIAEPVLQVKNVSKEFGGRTILRDINLEIKNIRRPDMTQGQVITLLGKSGSGKTTLANIIAGLLEPTTGHVLVNKSKNGGEGGVALMEPVKAGEVGFVFQNYLSFDHLTVRGNLLLAAYQGMFREHAEARGFSNFTKRLQTWIFNKKILQEKVNQYLEIFRLNEHLDKYPCQLSGGQRQRLAILSQVLCSSHYIILDEPFSGQDPEMKQKSCEVLIRVSQLDELETLIIITHDIECAVWVSDTLIPLGIEKKDGKALPGSTVYKPVDLIQQGLAWQDAEVCRTPQFSTLVQDIKYGWFPNM